MTDNAFMLAADGWVQISPLGDFNHAGAGVTQVIDREACDRIAADSRVLKLGEMESSPAKTRRKQAARAAVMRESAKKNAQR